MIDPQEAVYTSDPVSSELIPELRDLLHEYPLLTRLSSEGVARALHARRGIEVSVFEVQAALEALLIEGEVLA